MSLGKTRQINFYNIDEKFYFVDLPGYGYSKMSKREQEEVGKFIEEYLFSRENISLTILLIDIRHKPSENDMIMYEYIKNSGKPYIVVANKADKIAVTKVEARIDEVRGELGLCNDDVIYPFSSERKIYTENIWNIIDNWS